MIKNLTKVAKASEKIEQEERSSWMPIYYSFKTKTVYTKSGEDRFYVTHLIRPNTPEEIERTIEYWRSL